MTSLQETKRKTFYLFSRAANDLQGGIRLWRYWYYRSVISYRLGYRSSKLKHLWPVLSLIFVSSVIGLVWGILFNMPNKGYYFSYLVAGLPVWQILSGTVNNATTGFGSVSELNNLPLSTVLLEKWFRNYLPFLDVAPVTILLPLLLVDSGLGHFLYIPLAALVIFIWCFGVTAIVLVIVTLMPDIKHLINAFMRLSYLATPIIWEQSRLGEYQQLIWINPFYAPLQAGRYALSGFGEQILWEALIYSLSVGVIGFMVLSRYINRIRVYSI